MSGKAEMTMSGKTIGRKKTDALHIPVVNIETPPLEINLQRKASSLLRNVNRASVRYR